MSELTSIVNDYIRNFRQDAGRELRWFARQPSLEIAIEEAALARRPGGKRFSHQRRIPGTVLRESHLRLRKTVALLRRQKSFEALHALVATTIGPIHGIGPLTIYDTALRIGAFLGLEPNTVYLHAGTRVGARRLGFRNNIQSVRVDQLPRALRRLKAHEIEDVLCLYKDELQNGQLSPSLRGACYANAGSKRRRKGIC